MLKVFDWKWFWFWETLLHLTTYWMESDQGYVHNDFRIKTNFSSSFIPPVACRRAHVLFTLSVFVLWIVVSNTYCVLFLFVLCNLCWQFLPSVICRRAPVFLCILCCVFILFFFVYVTIFSGLSFCDCLFGIL
jgi:hypothetical protein